MSSGSARSHPAERLRHFYHVWAGGHYADAVAEHGAALRQAGLQVVPEVGIVGTAGQVRAARMVLDEHLPGWRLAVTAEQGFEQVTLHALRAAAKADEPATAFLYAHTKGAMSYSKHSDIWRLEMTDACVRGWRRCTQALAGGKDAAGGLWMADRRIFAGNFWWARAGYLASLRSPGPSPARQAACAKGECDHPEAPGDHDRFAAEDWVGTGPAMIEDVAPGLPCSRPVTIRMLHQISGGRTWSTEWPPIGGTMVVGELEAWELCHVYDGRDPPAYAERVSA